MGFSAAAERGQIKVVRGCRNLDAFFAEAEQFPGGDHDDTVDGASGAYTELQLLPVDCTPVSIESESSYWTEEEEELGGTYFRSMGR
jgi:hypothetical protein